jgi:dTDP-4-dehydrorhamnose 3,5-epimerase
VPKNGRILFVPKQCAHRYQTLEENTEMYYMTAGFYTPSDARGARFDEPDRNWPLKNAMNLPRYSGF